MSHGHKDSVSTNMEERTKDELRNMRVRNDHNEYSKENFDTIYNLLLKQGEKTSSQTKQSETMEEESKKITLGGFFSFQFMISSKLIQSSYIIGAFAVTIISWILLMRNQLLIAILSIVVGNLFWRITCEIAFIFFRMNEQLGLIQQKLKHSINV